MAALKFKERGNECVLKGSKYYPDALGLYSLAILHDSKDDSETTSVFYSNRSQVHLYLRNYRRAYWDAKMALQLCSTNVKVYYRVVKASLALGLLDQAKLHCSKGLQVYPDNEALKELAQEIDECQLKQGTGAAEGSEVEPTSELAAWSKLPIDILMLMARRLHFAEDYVNFGMVCKPWRVSFLENQKNPCSLLPWVLLPEAQERDVRRFYSPFNERVYEIYLPEIRKARCWGSSHSWLVTLDLERQMHLIDPLSRTRILLPPIHKCPDFGTVTINPITFRDDYVYRVILSSDPLSGDCMVLAAFIFGHLNFTKPGDEGWVSLQYDTSPVEDAMYFGRKFYVLLSCGDVVICDSNGKYLKKISVPTLVETHKGKEHCPAYILEIGGQIFVIARHMQKYPDSVHYRTLSFTVHRLDTHAKKWEEVKSLGDWSVFVGNNQSFAICGSDNPECTTNCVYFTDEHYELTERYFQRDFPVPKSYDIGVYCFDNHTVRPLVEMEFSRMMYYFLPVWIKPVLW